MIVPGVSGYQWNFLPALKQFISDNNSGPGISGTGGKEAFNDGDYTSKLDKSESVY